jgi:reverse gyrase
MARKRKMSEAHLSRVVRTMKQRGMGRPSWEYDNAEFRQAEYELAVAEEESAGKQVEKKPVTEGETLK